MSKYWISNAPHLKDTPGLSQSSLNGRYYLHSLSGSKTLLKDLFIQEDSSWEQVESFTAQCHVILRKREQAELAETPTPEPCKQCAECLSVIEALVTGLEASIAVSDYGRDEYEEKALSDAYDMIKKLRENQ